jgi:peptidyl-tRNA hydrolase
MASDPMRLYLVVRRGAFDRVDRAAALGGAAAVACVRRFEHNPRHAESFAAWRPRPGKVCLRARGGQWDEVRAEEHVLAGDPDGEGVLALPPRRRSQRGAVLERMQAMSSNLAGPPPAADPDDRAVTYLLNPEAEMSSGKAIAQVAHAAVMAADTGALEDWVAAGCPGRVLAPSPEAFRALAQARELAAEVVDAGLTELPPGTVTVRAVRPGAPTG